MDTPNTPAPHPKSSAWRRGAIALGLLGGGFVLGAVTLASAHGDMPWHGGFHHHGPRVGMIQHVVRGALENVGATTAQEDKIHDIIATTYTGLDKDKDGHEAMRKQVLDLLRAPTIDRAAVEKLRTDKVAEFDAKSKAIVGAVLDAAGQLTPEQRVKLAQNVEERMDHRGWGGWRHHGEGMHDEGMDQHGGPSHDEGDHPGGGEHHDHD